jgi:3-phenylpropionate/trans-cinnamate dioxygenase ferredoxin reductase component
VVIIGAGQGGLQCAASLRDHGWEGRIVLIGDEAGLPYSRPPLSKEYLRGEADGSELQLRPEKFFQRNEIDLIVDDAASAINRPASQVELASGSLLNYDELVLAVGASPYQPSPDERGRDGVAVLRDRCDADNLRERISHAKSIVIVGGGFIGTEVAAVACAHSDVTILEAGPQLLRRSVSTIVAQRARGRHEAHGIRVLTGTPVAAVEANGRYGHVVRLVEGTTLNTDLVLFATGVRPRTVLAAGAKLEVGDGILVDPQLRTSDPQISAVGDCANFTARFFAGRARLESVQNAVDQARHVAERLATGSHGPYDAVPWFWTHQHDDKIQIAGIADQRDDSMLAPESTADSFSVYRVRDGRVVAVESVNAPRDHMHARKRLASGAIPLEELAG